ncbi:unnamed protein product [Meloidogyne enterolobii]|uniref:Uncharacterized protein n=1 Tax=Meloidogyne enterolobii TaxID=390850 RepID=A0ACB1A173_MELEN
MKKFDKLEIDHVTDEIINRYRRCKPGHELYDFKLDEHGPCGFGLYEQKHKFFKPEPRFYNFELSEHLEKKRHKCCCL